MRRLVAVTLVFTVILVSFTACGQKSSETPPATIETSSATTNEASSQVNTEDTGDTGGMELPLVDKPVTLTTLAQTTVVASLNDSWAVRELANRTGITLNITSVAPDNYTDKVKMLIAAGNMPDLIDMSYTDANVYGPKGAIVAVNQNDGILPNFKSLFGSGGKYSWVMKSYSAEDGNLYFYPKFESNRAVNNGFMYRKDIFDKNGIKPWTNTDEFYNALKKLKEIYPESYPWANKYKEDVFISLSHLWGFSSSDIYNPLNHVVFYDEAAKSWQSSSTNDNWKDMLQFMQKLYKEKLLDPEFLTDTAASWTTKLTTGQSMVAFDWIGRMDMFYNQVKDSMPDYDLRYGGTIGPAGKMVKLPEVDSAGIVVKNGANKDAALKLLDYFASPAGSELMTMGKEGETYNVEADGKITYIGFDKGVAIGISDLAEKYGLFVQPTLYLKMDPRSVYFNFTEREQEAQDLLVNNNKIEAQDPLLKFTAQESEKLKELTTAMAKEVLTFSAQYVLTPSFGDAEWNGWKEKAEKLKIDEIVNIYNEAQKRYDQ